MKRSKSVNSPSSRRPAPAAMVRRAPYARLAMPRSVGGGLAVCASLASSSAFTWGCAAVYPAIDTPVRPAPAGVELDPPPPESLYYLALTGATVPQRTRGNEKWDELGDGAPDPYVKLYLDGETLFTTSTEQDSYTPKWSDAPRQNWVIPANAVLKVEMWNANPVNDQVICITEVDR